VYVAELVEDLRQTDHAQDRIDTLNRDFGKLCEAVAERSHSLAEPISARGFIGVIASVRLC
jgi:hypothetical protein